MELTVNHANYGLKNNTGWNLPEFGLQKFVSQTSESIFDTIHRSFDYKSKATTRELVTFLVFAAVLQLALIPTETYTTVHANLSMQFAAALTDLMVCVLPAIALIVRWMR